jgi:pimeloyl-ACP methyl ester carboxylesterase
MHVEPTAKAAAAVCCCVLGVLSSGCWSPPRASPRQQELGLVYMMPGIEGGPASLQWAYDGLRAGGVRAEIRIFDWHRGLAFLNNLTDYEGNLCRAASMAREIAVFKQARPNAPVDLVGYSGGGGLALLVAEALPPEIHLRNVVLAQAAISPEYDLTAALSRVDGQLVNFYCPSDWWTLGLGTRVFGTIDRRYTESAGKKGFDQERAVPDAQSRDKLIQIRWSADMLRTGHLGNHTAIVLREWNRRYVAPFLLPADQSASLSGPAGVR